MGGTDVLLVGGGGREHALAWRLSESRLVRRLLCAPGNPGIAALPRTTCLPVPATDLDRLVEIVRREAIGLVIVGPEAPLSAGLADAIADATGGACAVFGPSRRAAEIEASKAFSKGFMTRHGIPTAAYAIVGTEAEATAFLDEQAAAGRAAWVVKADGLCAGKGVTVCDEPDQALCAARALLRDGGRVGRVVIEERLYGREASCMALCDGEDVVLLPPCEDHKTIGDGDTGPMTGGMGALCPTPAIDADLLRVVRDQILLPAARGLLAEGRPFCGLLFAGVLCTSEGPRVLEFNCRFGDPETQPLLMLLQDQDLGELLNAVARHHAGELGPAIEARGAALCVVLAAAGYPGPPRRGDRITGLGAAEAAEAGARVRIFHAGTALTDGVLVTDGGRVLGVSAQAETPAAARDLAYRAVAEIRFDGAYYRRDIGAR